MQRNSVISKHLLGFALLYPAYGPTLPLGHVAGLAVNAIPYPPGAIIRVSMLATEPFMQSDLKQSVESDPNGTLHELRSVFRQEMSKLTAQMHQQGLRMLDQEKIAIDTIGGMIAISVTYP